MQAPECGIRRAAGASRLQPPARPAGEALAWSETSLDDAADAGPVISFWTAAAPVVAIGLSQDPFREADVEAMRRDGVALVRRQSGGGAVLLYPGVLCWEAWAGEEAIREAGETGAGIRRCYEALSRPVRAGLEKMGVKSVLAGICDVSVPAPDGSLRKVAGMAQLRRRNRVLVHGAILADADIGVLSKYLRLPGAEPEYRKGRGHREFCVSVAELLGRRRDSRDVGEGMIEAIRGEALRLGWEERVPPEEPDAAARRLADGKYLRDDWNWRRIRP